MRPSEELVDAFRAQGVKVTPQRHSLLRLLHDNRQHPTADVLFTQASDEIPGISLRTVYRTLTDLTAMGEIGQVTFGSGPAHFDPNVSDHHHAVCDECGAITDVYVDRADQLAIDGLAGFRPTRPRSCFAARAARARSRDQQSQPATLQWRSHQCPISTAQKPMRT